MPLSIKQEEFDKQIDLTLIRNFRKTGDIKMLGNVYAKYMPLVYGIGLKYFQDRALAQDLTMQVFEKLTKELNKHKIKNFKSWLYVVSKNQCLMELRKKNAETEKFKDWQNEQVKIMENGFELHPLDEEQNLTNALNDCIERLKTEQQICIDLFYYKKRCYQEIALNLEVEEKKVKSLIQNGKRNIKNCLESKNVKS